MLTHAPLSDTLRAPSRGPGLKRSAMRAVRFDRYGDYDALEIAEVPNPEPGPGELLIEVRAAGVNPFDNSVRAGRIPQVKPPAIPGNEGMGVVVAGDGLPAGTRVMLTGPFGMG